jgi:hypothetical protein
VRILVTLACLFGLAGRARAQTTAPLPPTEAEQRYVAQKKSVPLAVTLEALSPIAGTGALYAHDNDRGLTLAIVSAVAAGAGVGSAFWLLHLSHQQESGFNRTVQDFEQGTAISVLATAAVVYLVARISGLALAPEATDAYNDELRKGLGLPPPEPVVPFHALGPSPTLSLGF